MQADPHSGAAGNASSRPLRPTDAAQVTSRIAAISVAAAIFLIFIKSGAWALSGSIAMLSSLADSALDLAASVFTFFAVRYAATPPDSEHRFGHGKAEAFAGIFQAGLVVVSAGLIAMEAFTHVLHPVRLEFGWTSLIVMAVSIAITFMLVLAQSRAIAKTGSVATKGDRAHYAADLGANVVVILGIAAAAFLGWGWADSVAGLLIAVWLVFSAVAVAKESADHLMDREMPEEQREQVRALAQEDPLLHRVHDLRTRLAGPYVHIQFHVDLDPDMRLEDAHKIIVAAEKRIRTAFPAADVIIHADPANRAEPHGLENFGERRKA
jgi:ferrous-iron efflux pump FieF